MKGLRFQDLFHKANERFESSLLDIAEAKLPSQVSSLLDELPVFWSLQVGGWMLYVILQIAIANLQGLTDYFLLASVAEGAAGVAITLLLREYFQWLWRYSSFSLLLSVLLVTLPAGLLFAFAQLAIRALVQSSPDVAQLTLVGFTNAWYLMVIWSTLYFGIRYFITMQKQRQQLELLKEMAHHAHLKMLRYQIHPHFLFNTLNAIASLVMSKQSEQSDQALNMLLGLSSYLRYSLELDPTQKLTVKRELQAVQDYLRIEQIRFAKRLHVVWEVHDGVWEALMPSLILQPIIENAIKYAVAPDLQGATVTIDVRQLKKQKLQLTVQDDGPGLPELNVPKSDSSGTGLGLANIRERLQMIYAGNQTMEISNLDAGGVQVRIVIPYELAPEETEAIE